MLKVYTNMSVSIVFGAGIINTQKTVHLEVKNFGRQSVQTIMRSLAQVLNQIT